MNLVFIVAIAAFPIACPIAPSKLAYGATGEGLNAMNTSKSWRVLGAALIAVLAGGVFLYVRTRAIEVHVVGPSTNVTVRVFGLGTVEARILSKIGFEVGATLVELDADHGDLVKKGDVLARLHSSEQEAKLVKSKAGVASAEADLKRAEANVLKAQAILRQKQEDNRRKQTLAGRQVVSEQSADEALRDEEVAKAELSVAESDVEIARARADDARAQYEFEKTVLDHHVLYAPFDAVIVERHKEAGSGVNAGDTVFTLVAPETVWGMAFIDEANSGNIREGQDAEVRLRSLPQQTFAGKVARIGIESDRVTEERRVYVRCEQCPAQFHLGEQIEVYITVASLDAALLVPEASVRHFNGRSAKVWTVEHGRLAQRSVTTGLRTEDSLLEITGGLPDGARVILDPPRNAREGALARIAGE